MPRPKSNLQRGRGRNFSVTAGPFVGVVDATDPNGADWSKYLQGATNYWLRPGAEGLETRPGFSANHYLAAQPGNCRMLFQWIKKDGTKAPIGAFDNSGTVKFVNLSTGADVTPTTYTFADSGGQMYAVMFNDKAIVSDGDTSPMVCDFSGANANTKILFDGSTTEAAYGAPWIYQSKLFFIRKSDRLRILWSEENDSATGYIQTNFTNFWTFAQTSYEPLCAGIATNERIYLFRARSIDGLTGNADGTFSSYGTVDGISSEIGCPLAACIQPVGAKIYFLDMYGRLHAIIPGPSVQDLWFPANHVMSIAPAILSDGTAAANAAPFRQLVYWQEADLLLHQHPQSATIATYCHAWQETSGHYLGRWVDGGTESYLQGMISASTSQGWQQIAPLYVSSVRKLFRTDSAFRVDVMSIQATDNIVAPVDPTGQVTTQAITGPIFSSDEVDCVFEEAVTSLEWGATPSGGITFRSDYQTSLHTSASFGNPHMATTGSGGFTLVTGQVRDGLKARGRSIQYLLVCGYDALDGNKQPWHRLHTIRIDGTVVGNKSETNTPTAVWAPVFP